MPPGFDFTALLASNGGPPAMMHPAYVGLPPGVLPPGVLVPNPYGMPYLTPGHPSFNPHVAAVAIDTFQRVSAQQLSWTPSMYLTNPPVAHGLMDWSSYQSHGYSAGSLQLTMDYQGSQQGPLLFGTYWG